MKITVPGIYRGISEADYRADPCPSPSLTQSLCKILIERSPRHAWVECPSLNPNYEREEETKFDIGNVAHRLILGRGKEIEVVPFADWRKKEAQEAREAAADRGVIAVLQHQFDQASDMVAGAWLQLDRHDDRNAFKDGSGEVMIAWEEDGIWFRALIDWLHDDLRTVDDYKTTAKSVAPHAIGMVAQSAGWEVQAAFIERGLAALNPDGAGRRRYRFVAQETDKPNALTVMHMGESWLTMGRKKVQVGADLWRVCSETGYWPSYPRKAIVPDYPSFRESQWLDREVNEFSEPPLKRVAFDPKNMMAG